MGKRGGKKKDKTKMACYNYGKMGHFAWECIELKKLQPNSNISHYSYVTSSLFLTKSRPLSTIDSGVTDYITQD